MVQKKTLALQRTYEEVKFLKRHCPNFHLIYKQWRRRIDVVPNRHPPVKLDGEERGAWVIYVMMEVWKGGPYCLPWQQLLSCELLAISDAGTKCLYSDITQITHYMWSVPSFWIHISVRRGSGSGSSDLPQSGSLYGSGSRLCHHNGSNIFSFLLSFLSYFIFSIL